ncbi:hypothetical protein OPV22_030197 [Ensete ventricosum]|uniref:Uncharacterized protein n=1 Tax=Ensete ventricosum TaxID=4639 RepID=A0AAV8QFD1_ENSVE|nr:hypothetical protein OPV22_030197 [Ensete ventricosum]
MTNWQRWGLLLQCSGDRKNRDKILIILLDVKHFRSWRDIGVGALPRPIASAYRLLLLLFLLLRRKKGQLRILGGILRYQTESSSGVRREAPAKDAEFVDPAVAAHHRPGRGGRTEKNYELRNGCNEADNEVVWMLSSQGGFWEPSIPWLKEPSSSIYVCCIEHHERHCGYRWEEGLLHG